MTDSEFKTIKQHLLSGLPVGRVCKISGRSHSVVSLIESSESFEQYRSTMTTLNLMYKRRRLEAKTVARPSPDGVLNDLRDLEQILDTLKEKVGSIIQAAVEQKVRIETNKFVNELQELRDFKETARQVNWSSTVADNLRGNFK